ncbi:MAG TPA: transposase [Ferroplasma sp.]|jgi:putative transposase|nr:transposase [Ferroplasma sp.]HII82224.1 transposase [Ferroplasma sp.]
MIEYKSQKKGSIYVNSGWTSSECPLSGEKIKHPIWKIFRCETCNQDYERDRLVLLAITPHGLDLFGNLFAIYDG